MFAHIRYEIRMWYWRQRVHYELWMAERKGWLTHFQRMGALKYLNCEHDECEGCEAWVDCIIDYAES